MLESSFANRMLHRRSFLRVAGATTAASTLLLAGCGGDGTSTSTANPVITLSADDSGLLNSLLVHTRVQIAFYEAVLAAPPSDTSAEEKEFFQQIYEILVVHRVYLGKVMEASSLSTTADLTTTFATLTLSSRQGVLTAARMFADLGTSLYVNALANLNSAFFVRIASKMSPVIGRQAALLHDLVQAGSFADSTVVEASGFFAGLERQLTPTQVYTELNKYFANNITISAASLPTS